MVKSKMTDQERKAKALAYSQDRANRLVALGACRMCGRHKETGEKISLREPKATPEPTGAPKGMADPKDPFAGRPAEQAAEAQAATPKARTAKPKSEKPAAS